MADTNTSDMQVIQGSMTINGNLTVDSQITTKDLKVVDDNYKSLLTTSGNLISFKKSCEFLKPVEFNNGQTIIGIESTYKSAYIGTPTLQVGNRLIVGDSDLKITNDDRTILAETFKMSIYKILASTIQSKKILSDSIETPNLKVTDEIISQSIYADTIKTNNLAIENIRGISLDAGDSITTKDLLVNGTGVFEQDVTINGRLGGTNGASLTVNGGPIVANWGITSNTKDNLFQTLTITGNRMKSGSTCLHVQKGYDSLFEGDVTIQNANLILDDSKFVTEDIVVTSLSEDSIKQDSTTGVELTTKGNWDGYVSSMISESQSCSCQCSSEILDEDNNYDPVNYVDKAMERNKSNYNQAELRVKNLVNPVSYIQQRDNKCLPRKFKVNYGIYRIDSYGNAMFKNVVSEKATFSRLDAYDFNVNNLKVDKIVNTSVASNVVHTDQLLKSEGIAEFDGAINSKADIFIEDNSNVNVMSGSTVNVGKESKVNLNGVTLNVDSSSKVNLNGRVEIPVKNLVFVGKNGNKYQIDFIEDCNCGCNDVVMTYSKYDDSVDKSEANASTTMEELNEKLKSLGL